MFGPYSFLIYMLIFTLPPIVILWAKFPVLLWKNKKIILCVILAGLVSQVIADPFAERWNAWYFPRETTLGLWILGFPIENTIFTILIAANISSAVLTLIHMESSGQLRFVLGNKKKK